MIIKEGDYAHLTPPPFPSALKSKKKKNDDSHILEVLKQVKVNTPLLYVIRQRPMLNF